MQKITFPLLLLASIFFYNVHAQVTGIVTNVDNEPLSFVNIYLENTITGTTTNDNGLYQLELSQTGTHTIVFKYLGFKTHKQTITINKFPFTLHVSLREETVLLSEVEVNVSYNPANRIIRAAISKRKSYLKKMESYTAEFYSKGLIKIKDAPEKILGRELGDFGGGLDSTRSGIIYLSETISKIAKNKNDYNEKIIASKVSGDDNGFSFNNASDVDLSYYNNTLEFGNTLISPIADNAFTYYRYKLIGTFYDGNKNLINQVAVIPKRSKDKVFTGDIYIVEHDWAIYATDLSVTGEQAHILAVDSLFIKQSFNYSANDKLWLKVLQSFDFQFKILGFKGDGRFTAGYKNYNIRPNFSKNDFGSEVLSFKKEANKKDSLYWTGNRPVPLTLEEVKDYQVKDSVEVIRKSQKYLDSIDAENNRVKLSSVLFGYSHDNTFKEKHFRLESPIAKTSYNTVEGWSIGIGMDYVKQNKKKGSQFNMGTKFTYGLSDNVLRPIGEISYRFNNFSRPYLKLSGGKELVQFNPSNPVPKFTNSFRTLFFENNFGKFYDKTFAKVFYSDEIINGINLSSDLGYEQRNPVYNTTDYVIVGNDDDQFTSNNPLDPLDFINAGIDRHNIIKFELNARFRFGQKYLNHPDGKFNISSSIYPTLFMGYEKGMAASNSNYNFDQLKIRLTQRFTIRDKGNFTYNLRAGTFLNEKAISFVDYQHFNGNRTHVTLRDYLDSFYLLPYYELSTNQDYFEAHMEYNLKGFIMGKIPLLNKLNSNLIFDGKLLSTSNHRPYFEFSVGLGNLGWKTFRFLRLDYVRSSYRGLVEDGINIGLQF